MQPTKKRLNNFSNISLNLRGDDGMVPRDQTRRLSHTPNTALRS